MDGAPELEISILISWDCDGHGDFGSPLLSVAAPQSSAGTARLEFAIVTFFRCLILAVSMVLWNGCSIQPLQQHPIDELGYLEYRESEPHAAGIAVGVPHAYTEPAAIEYAAAFSAKSGAGIVTAYGFGSKRVPVAQPLVRSIAVSSGARDPQPRGSIYPEFKLLLQTAAKGRLRFYLGVRIAGETAAVDRIEIASTGLTNEQLKALADAYTGIRNREIQDTDAPVVSLSLDPIDEITWLASGVKHHGVLMLAERGFSIRLPAILATDPAKRIYIKILSRWVEASLDIIRNNPDRLPKTEISVLDFGKIETIPGKRGQGIVIGAPHGTFDVYTAGIVRAICTRIHLAGIIATGFTPTETEDGRRINVNRPTERYFAASDREYETERAQVTYARFKSAVLNAAQAQLELYVDIHQNGGERIEVATVGVSKEEARRIKSAFYSLRYNALATSPEIAAVDFAIEPLDDLEVGAWGAKATGILTVAKRSLHFELPAAVLASARQRVVYTKVLAALIKKVADQPSATE